MSPLRPDLVDCWIYRAATDGDARDAAPVGAGGSDRAGAGILLLRRAPGRILPGLWQCVSGSLEPGERVAMGALRELREETGFGPDAIEAFYDLDLVNQFHEPSVDAVVLPPASPSASVPARSRSSRTSTTRCAGFPWTTPTARWSGRATARRSTVSAATSWIRARSLVRARPRRSAAPALTRPPADAPFPPAADRG